jgi:hypothetical protein
MSGVVSFNAKVSKFFEASKGDFFDAQRYLRDLSVYFDDETVLQKIKESASFPNYRWLVQAITEYVPAADE